MMKTQIQDIYPQIRKIVLEAGKMVYAARQSGDFSIGWKGSRDAVTSADTATDAFLCEQLKKLLPNSFILSEESSPTLSVDHATQGWLWVVDPIDGTVNFAHGQPQVAVSVALLWQGAAQIGIVYAPFQNEIFHGIRDAGSFLNDQKLAVSRPRNLKESLIATGFPYDRSDIELLVRRVRSVLLQCQDVRRIGSGALDTCWVACGRLDAYYETVRPWDIAAAGLIAREAGATMRNLTRSKFGLEAQLSELDGNEFVVGSPAIFEEVIKMLQEA